MSTLSRVIFDPDTTPPSIPLSVVATALSTTTIRVTWAPSTDAGGSGLAGYRVYRSTTLTGSYGQVSSDLSTASLSFDDTTLSGSQQRFYRVRAFDGNGNVSGLSAIVNATTPAGTGTNVIRFAPGHYKFLDHGSGGGGQSGELAQIAALSGKAYMAGAKAVFDWDDIETSQNVYTFAKTDAYVNQATAINKKLMIGVRIQYFSTGVVSPAGRFPSYLSTAGTGGTAGYAAWDGNPPSPSGNLALVLKLWDPPVMVRFNALWSALAGRYKDNVTVVMISYGETSIGDLNGSGYSMASFITQTKNWMTTQRAAWPNTEVRMLSNYISGDNASKDAMKDLEAFMFANRIAGGGPDNFSRTYDSNPVYTGFNGGIDYRNRFSWVSESQYPAGSSGGPSAGDTDATTSPVPSSANIYAHNESGALSAGGSTKPNYYVWFNNTYTGNPPSTGTYHTYPAETEPFIASINGACNTVNPYSLYTPFHLASFDAGTPGQLASGSDAFANPYNDGAVQTLFSNAIAGPYGGGQVAAVNMEAGDGGFGGEMYATDIAVANGDELWVRVWHYFPASFSFGNAGAGDENGFTKWLRLQWGPNDGGGNRSTFEINADNESIGKCLFEIPNDGNNRLFPIQTVFPRNQWVCIEWYVRFGTRVPSASGSLPAEHDVTYAGSATETTYKTQPNAGLVRAWVNGVFQGERGIATMPTGANQGNLTGIYFGDYWNGGVPQPQTLYLDEIVMTLQQPNAVDSGGRPMIGTTRRVSDF